MMEIIKRKPEGLAGRVTQTLREYVRNLPEGTKLVPEPELAKELGISRTTLRSALAVLEREGLLERAPRRGTIVRRPERPKPANIGVISPLAGWERSGSFYGEVYKGINAAAATFRVDVTHLLGSLGRDITPAAIRGLTWERFDALLVFELFDAKCAHLLSERADSVVYLDFDATKYGITSVVFDNLGAASAVTEALMDMGHEHFAFIGPELGGKGWQDPAYMERLRGVMDAVTRRGGVFLAQHILAVNKGDPPEVLKPLLETPPSHRPTAIIAADSGYGAIVQRAAEKGLVRVPQDLSLAIFGSVNSPSMETTGGAFFDGREMGYRAVEVLHRQLNQHTQAGQLVREGFILRLEHTVRAIRRGGAASSG